MLAAMPWPGNHRELEGVVERTLAAGTADPVRVEDLRFEPAGALCELMADDGSMLRGDALVEFARRHGLPYLHIGDLVNYRRATERRSASVAQDAAPQHCVLPEAHA